MSFSVAAALHCVAASHQGLMKFITQKTKIYLAKANGKNQEKYIPKAYNAN